MLILSLLNCFINELAPTTPECNVNESLYFTAEPKVVTESRETDSEYHNEGPMVAIFDIENDGIPEIFQCFPFEKTYIYSLRGKKKFSNRCGFMLAEDLNDDGWIDLVVDESLGNLQNGRINI